MTDAAKLNSRKLLTTMHYQASMMGMYYILIPAVLLFNFAIAMATRSDIPAGSVDSPALVFSLIIGIQLQGIIFKHCIYSGVSRRTFFAAALVNIFVFAAVLSLFTCVLLQIIAESGQVSSSLFTLLYIMAGDSTDARTFGVGTWLLWAFTFNLAMAVLGWFCKVVYMALSKTGRRLAFAGLVVLSSVFTLINTFVQSGFAYGWILFVLGLNGIPDPYLACLHFGLSAVVFGTGTYLILRRVQIQ